jgi:hypothetical protein
LLWAEVEVELMLQTLIVAVVVLASSVFAAWRLMPARTKLRVLDSLKPASTNAVGRWLGRLRAGVISELTHGCGTCSQSPEHVKKH